ncbi:uncharacterized protein LOC111025112 [Momordica charantia]|uniref:Uncharacterized protein LOC111025112 n=1 Tax=Momordica charantia TaxID=3673 RepID=A0A6J1DWQ5_MOMCH|nr:uncharacterized protein LOC111025112 [Momordica charantia]
MATSIISLVAAEKLNDENYTQWKINLNMILVLHDLRFILIEECLQVSPPNAARVNRDVYDRWTKVNDEVKVYILASMSDVLAKKHENMVTTREIMDSLQDMFGQPSV